MNFKEMLARGKKTSKDEDLPGTVLSVLTDVCPLCGRPMREYKACCGSPKGYIGCRNCNYKVNL
jgi:hypothetical protein